MTDVLLPLTDVGVVSVLLAGVTVLLVGLAVLLRSGSQVAWVFALFTVAVAVWCFGVGLEATAAELDTKRTWAGWSYLGVATTPPLWLLFTLLYSNRMRRFRRRSVLLFGVPLITLLLAVTSEGHGLMFGRVWLEGGGPLRIEHGPWFWGVHVPYSNALLVAGMVILAEGWRQARGLQRQQYTLFLIAGLVGLLFSLPFLFGWRLLGGMDPTPLGIGVASLVIAVGLMRYRLFDLSPIAYRTVFLALPDPLLVVDVQGRVAELNQAAADGLGHPRSALLGRRMDELLPDWPELVARFGEQRTPLLQVTLPMAGESRHLEVRSAAIHDPGGRQVGHVVIARDISERKTYQDLALRDPLTGLGNRRLYERQARELLGRPGTSSGGTGGAVLYCDLDGFKQINDRFGHEVGDRVLQEVAERLRIAVRHNDVVARIGGDEFAALLPGVSAEEAQQLARRLVTSLQRPFLVVDEGVLLGLSVGVALYPVHGSDPEALLRHADAAMYRAKTHRLGVSL